MKYFKPLFLVCVTSISLSSISLAQTNGSIAGVSNTATSADCAAQAVEKKLAGAALNSFTKKCERDAATESCITAASDRKLRGAAKNSFTKKCIKDATNRD